MWIHRLLALQLGILPLVFAALGVCAQNTDTGIVQGRVFCADTQKPARFANVRLQPIDISSGRARGGFASTGTDGSFRITGVSPGEYYADVMMPGYVQPLRGLRDPRDISPSDRDRLNAQLTRVSVTTGQSATVQVTIYRGATVSGGITFDDGSVAPGVAVQAYLLDTSSPSAEANGPSQGVAANARTDDRGQYRLTGLIDGTYIIFAAPRSVFPIYYGNTIERSAAKKLELRAGGELSGADIQIPAAGMHRVSGVVVSRQDGHPLSSASLQLQLSSGDSGSISTVAATDGTFSFAAVPDGKFTVQVSSAFSDGSEIKNTGQAVEVSGTDITDLIINTAARN
jgi:hypothetical protein